ncbi:TPA: sensor histidine kinase [Legionella pneumophila]|nr:PAS domain-containing protein [Legionella pneumophila]HBD7101203.1 sensor histidine kinase [Legionella pneumophila]HDU7928159.1 sensor histidine kinase [Legionella pneumophila]HDU7934290.1 sensor histidine kinase [Legionella pneumophila]HDU7961502.1 sensor histidine kinase [Legionella pneumophila]
MNTMHYSTYQTCAVKPQIELSEWDILSSLPTALVILNAQGKVVWLNPSAEAMLGYGLIGSLWLDVIQKAFVPRADDGHEVSLADGRRVHVAISSLESLPGILITLSDITASRDYEEAKENEKRLVSIGTMTAQLAHQIRTPLSSAILYTEHLNNLPNLDHRIKNWIHRLQECHASIEQQIQDLLLFARGTSIEPKYVDMEFWCSQLIQRAQPYIESYAAILHVNNHLITRESSIHGESLIGAILNLIINALQSEATQIDLTLASMDDSGIQISVEDNGNGMSEEVRAQAFSPFYTTKAQGTGLGLAVVFAVVKAHGGRVTLESTEGIGTQVTIYLPCLNRNVG